MVSLTEEASDSHTKMQNDLIRKELLNLKAIRWGACDKAGAPRYFFNTKVVLIKAFIHY